MFIPFGDWMPDQAALDSPGSPAAVNVAPGDKPGTYRSFPKLVEFTQALGSRVLGGSARAGGMPMYKYMANRLLTFIQNLLGGAKLSEYHTGYRAFSRQVIESLALNENSDDFVFDNQMLAQIIHSGFKIGEVSCPAAYFEEASSINFQRSVKYGLGVLLVSVQLFLERYGLASFPIFASEGRRLETARPAANGPSSPS